MTMPPEPRPCTPARRPARWRDILIDLLASATLPLLFWGGVSLWILGALLDIPNFRRAGMVILALFVLYLLAGFAFAVRQGFVMPVHFWRRYRTYTTAEKFIYTPLITLLILMMLALIATGIALAIHHARGNI